MKDFKSSPQVNLMKCKQCGAIALLLCVNMINILLNVDTNRINIQGVFEHAKLILNFLKSFSSWGKNRDTGLRTEQYASERWNLQNSNLNSFWVHLLFTWKYDFRHYSVSGLCRMDFSDLRDFTITLMLLIWLQMVDYCCSSSGSSHQFVQIIFIIIITPLAWSWAINKWY